MRSKHGGIDSSFSTGGTLWFPIPGWIRRACRDPETPDTAAFPFGIVVATILLTGISVIGWGITITSATLTVVGILTMMAGCLLYDWSLYED